VKLVNIQNIKDILVVIKLQLKNCLLFSIIIQHLFIFYLVLYFDFNITNFIIF